MTTRRPWPCAMCGGAVTIDGPVHDCVRCGVLCTRCGRPVGDQDRTTCDHCWGVGSEMEDIRRDQWRRQ